MYLIGWGRAVLATAPPTDAERARASAPTPGALIAKRAFTLPGTFLTYLPGDRIDGTLGNGEAAFLIARGLVERAPAAGRKRN